ncbi:MAG TPA: BON domain-containing protein [Thermoanaerobaculia bacterium]|nr:BON domain-containing protein [Thermoanaerobaculia bacterium]
MKRELKLAALIAVMMLLVSAAANAAAPQTLDLTDKFREAGATVDRLQVYELAGIVIIRGRTADPAQAAQLSLMAKNLGYTRVANLIQIAQHDDVTIARKAEVQLSIHRSLDGCRFRVRSDQGVLHVAGQVRHELQKDVAVQVLRNIDGVRSVQMDLRKF